MNDLEAEEWVNEMMTAQHEADLLRAYKHGKLVGENKMWKWTLTSVAVALLLGFALGLGVGQLWR